MRTSGKLSYGPKVGRPLNVRGRLAEWDLTIYMFGYTRKVKCEQYQGKKWDVVYILAY